MKQHRVPVVMMVKKKELGGGLCCIEKERGKKNKRKMLAVFRKDVLNIRKGQVNELNHWSSHSFSIAFF